MSSLRNKVQLIGHLGAAPEVKNFENTKLASIRIATNESYKTQTGEWQTETTWHRVTLWGNLADRATQQLDKGSFVLIEGKLVNREYTDAQGVKKYVTEVRANSFMALDKKDNGGDANNELAKEPEENDGLPF